MTTATQPQTRTNRPYGRPGRVFAPNSCAGQRPWPKSHQRARCVPVGHMLHLGNHHCEADALRGRHGYAGGGEEIAVEALVRAHIRTGEIFRRCVVPKNPSDLDTPENRRVGSSTSA
jgi:hypothetical protein